jgi:uncharacterized 2Fe-2S/4Fe-4S cluster protein (DUF4445 family)
VRYRGRTAEFILAYPNQTATGRDIVVTQQDIRAIQLAKGALYAGTRLLMDHLGVDRVDRIKLAGAFGSYIDPLHALILGLIPDCDLEHVKAVGNSAGDGARIALLNAGQRKVAEQAARAVQYVEIAVEPEFQTYFVNALALPHAVDAFPHLKGIVPEPAKHSPAKGQNRRRIRRQKQTAS